jgi:hypothetical protein
MTLEKNYKMILDRDIRTMGHEVIIELSTDMLNEYQFACSNADLRNGQPHQLARRLLRENMIAKLEDEELLDEILIGEISSQG